MLPAASLEKRVLHHFQNELQYTGESKTRFVSDEFRVKLLDPIGQYAQIVNIRICGAGHRSVAEENSSRCGAQLLFE